MLLNAYRMVNRYQEDGRSTNRFIAYVRKCAWHGPLLLQKLHTARDAVLTFRAEDAGCIKHAGCPGPERLGRKSDALLEEAGEIGRVGKAQRIGDRAHRHSGIYQVALGFEQQAFMDQVKRRLPGGLPAQGVQVRRSDP